MEENDKMTEPLEPEVTEATQPEAPKGDTVELVYHGNPQRAINHKRRKPSDYPFKNECGEPIRWRCRKLGILDPVSDGDTLVLKKADLEDPTIKGMLAGTDSLYRTLTYPGDEFPSPEIEPDETPQEEAPADEVSITETDDSAPEEPEAESDGLNEALIGVKGIGKKMAADIVGAYPNKALILMAMETDELADAIAGLTTKHYKSLTKALGKL